MVITGLAATGTKVLYEFSRHDLELYCRRRNQRQLFDEILDRHEDFAIAAETLQVVGMCGAGALRWPVVFSRGSGHPLGCSSIWPSSPERPSSFCWCSRVWIPWAIVHVWSAPFLFHTWRFWTAVAWILWPLTLGVKLMDVIVHRLAGHHETEEDEEEAFEDEIRTIVTGGTP